MKNLTKEKLLAPYFAIKREAAPEVQDLESKEALKLAHDRYSSNAVRFYGLGMIAVFAAAEIYQSSSLSALALMVMSMFLMFASGDFTGTLEYIEKEIDRRNNDDS